MTHMTSLSHYLPVKHLLIVRIVEIVMLTYTLSQTVSVQVSSQVSYSGTLKDGQTMTAPLPVNGPVTINSTEQYKNAITAALNLKKSLSLMVWQQDGNVQHNSSVPPTLVTQTATNTMPVQLPGKFTDPATIASLPGLKDQFPTKMCPGKSEQYVQTLGCTKSQPKPSIAVVGKQVSVRGLPFNATSTSWASVRASIKFSLSLYHEQVVTLALQPDSVNLSGPAAYQPLLLLAMPTGVNSQHLDEDWSRDLFADQDWGRDSAKDPDWLTDKLKQMGWMTENPPLQLAAIKGLVWLQSSSQTDMHIAYVANVQATVGHSSVVVVHP